MPQWMPAARNPCGAVIPLREDAAGNFLAIRVKRRLGMELLVSGFKFNLDISAIRNEQLETRNMKLETFNLKRLNEIRFMRNALLDARQQGL